MPIFRVNGDPLLTDAQALAFPHNLRGSTPAGTFVAELERRYPPAFSMYAKQCRTDRIKAGTFWHWRENTPHLLFLVVNQSPNSMPRLRHVQSCMHQLARDYQRESLRSIAITPLSNGHEWQEIMTLIEKGLKHTRLIVYIYEGIEHGVKAQETTD